MQADQVGGELDLVEAVVQSACEGDQIGPVEGREEGSGGRSDDLVSGRVTSTFEVGDGLGDRFAFGVGGGSEEGREFTGGRERVRGRATEQAVEGLVTWHTTEHEVNSFARGQNATKATACVASVVTSGGDWAPAQNRAHPRPDRR